MIQFEPGGEDINEQFRRDFIDSSLEDPMADQATPPEQVELLQKVKEHAKQSDERVATKIEEDPEVSQEIARQRIEKLKVHMSGIFETGVGRVVSEVQEPEAEMAIPDSLPQQRISPEEVSGPEMRLHPADVQTGRASPVAIARGDAKPESWMSGEMRKITNLAESLNGKMIEDRTGGQYKLDKLLGVGGMGMVFKAEKQIRFFKDKKKQNNLQKAFQKVGGWFVPSKKPKEKEEELFPLPEQERKGIERAIKFQRPGTKENAVAAERFEREIACTKDIRSPFILRSVDRIDVEIDGEPLVGYVTEFVNGSDLKSEIVKSYHEGVPERMDPLSASEIMAEIAVALWDVQQAGLIHRDLKPDNVFLQKMSDGTYLVKLGDFGIAKEVGQESEEEEENLFGTPDYMSPEQAKLDKTISHRSDVYAAGVLFYQLLTGGYPYQKTTSLIGKLSAHLHQAPKSFEEAGASNVPEELQELVMRMLSKDPNDRPKDGLEVFSAIKTWIAKEHPKMLMEMPFKYSFDGKDPAHYYAMIPPEEVEMFEPDERSDEDVAV